MKPARLLSLLALLSLSSACSKAPEPAKSPDGARDEHAGHDHPTGGHDHPKGERIDIGTAKIGEYDVHAFQVGKLVPGKEGEFDLEFTAALPSTVRAWVGLESGQGSMKAKFGKETDHQMHGDPEIPSPLPAGAKLWVEIESKGSMVKGSFALKP